MSTKRAPTIVEAPKSGIGEKPGGLAERAKTSRAAAVKLFCIQCVGGVRADVRDCTARDCALYPHRPYRPKEDK